MPAVVSGFLTEFSLKIVMTLLHVSFLYHFFKKTQGESLRCFGLAHLSSTYLIILKVPNSCINSLSA